MRRIRLAAFAVFVWVVSPPYSGRQSIAGAFKKESRIGAKLNAHGDKNQQSPEITALNSALATIAKDEQERAADAQKEKDVERENVRAEWWLVGVGIAQAFALIATLGVICYQAKKTAEATQAMRNSLPLQKSTADAALLNAQAAISAARPWISFFATHDNGFYTFKAANLGNTPAKIISFATGTEFVDRVETLPVPPEYAKDQFPALALLANDHYADGANLIVGTFDSNSIRPPDLQKQVVAFFFRVIYENPSINISNLGAPRYESRMCFWYKIGEGTHPQLGGPREYNEHT